MRHPHFLEDMQRGRDNAMRNRNRGHHVGAQAKGWTAKRSHPEAGSIDRFDAISRSRWEGALADFVEGIKFDVFGHTWEGL